MVLRKTVADRLFLPFLLLTSSVIGGAAYFVALPEPSWPRFDESPFRSSVATVPREEGTQTAAPALAFRNRPETESEKLPGSVLIPSLVAPNGDEDPGSLVRESGAELFHGLKDPGTSKAPRQREERAAPAETTVTGSTATRTRELSLAWHLESAGSRTPRFAPSNNLPLSPLPQSASLLPQPARATLPAALVPSPQEADLNRDQATQLQDISQKFMATVGGPTEAPPDVAYRERWLNAQAIADQRFKLLFGYQAFLMRQIALNEAGSSPAP